MNELNNKLNTVLSKKDIDKRNSHQIHKRKSSISKSKSKSLDNTTSTEESNVLDKLTNSKKHQTTSDKEKEKKQKFSTSEIEKDESKSTTKGNSKNLTDTLKYFNQNSELMFQNNMLKHELELIKSKSEEHNKGKLKTTKSKKSVDTTSKSEEKDILDSITLKTSFDEKQLDKNKENSKDKSMID